jgi:hypothetical protein
MSESGSPSALLTDQGFQTLAAVAAGHVARVRSLVIDVLSPEQLRRLGLVADRNLFVRLNLNSNNLIRQV